MSDWTQAMVDAHQAKLGKKSATVGAFGKLPPFENKERVCEPKKSPEEKLNKLERRWLEELKRRGYEDIKVQAIKLQLGFDCLYLPDFFTPGRSGDGWIMEPVMWECKGHRWAKNMIKLRVAARVHNWAKFVLVEWKDGQWIETPISP